MASKYVSLEEAAAILGIPTIEVTRLREAGELRGFADRGTWKFQRTALEEYARRQESGSVELNRSDNVLADPPRSALPGQDEVVGDQSTVIRKAGEEDASRPSLRSAADSSSDVRLVDVVDEMRSRGDLSDLGLLEEIVDRSREPGEADAPTIPPIVDRDEPEALVLPDLDDAGDKDDLYDAVFGDDEPGSGILTTSESGIFLDAPGDSGIDLAQMDSSIVVPPDDELSLSDGSTLSELDSGAPLLGDSDLTLKQQAEADEAETIIEDLSPPEESVTDSDTGLLAEDSSLTLEGSGLSLSDADSHMSVFEDGNEEGSGISLEDPDQSGIALDTAESGIALEGDSPFETATYNFDLVEDAGFADSPSPAPRAPAPAASAESDDVFETIDTDDPVLVLDDEDADGHSPTMIRTLSEHTVDELEIADDFDIAEADDDEVFVDDEDLVGEDDAFEDFDEGDDEYLEADDVDFEEDEFGAEPVESLGRRSEPAVPAEPKWGIGEFVGLTLAVLILAVNGVVAFESMRTMWSGAADPTPVSGLVDILKDTFRG